MNEQANIGSVGPHTVWDHYPNTVIRADELAEFLLGLK